MNIRHGTSFGDIHGICAWVASAKDCSLLVCSEGMGMRRRSSNMYKDGAPSG